MCVQEGAPKKPQDVATAIIKALPDSDAIAETPTIAGAGFINVKLKKEWISERIRTMLVQVVRTLCSPISIPKQFSVVSARHMDDRSAATHYCSLCAILMG